MSKSTGRRVTVYRVYQGAIVSVGGERTADRVELDERLPAFDGRKRLPPERVAYSAAEATAQEKARIAGAIAHHRAELEALYAERDIVNAIVVPEGDS